MWHPVDRDADPAGLVLDVDLVVRRPAEPAAQRLDAEQQDQRRQRHHRQPGDAVVVQRDEAGGGDQRPPERRGVHERQRREGRDAGEAAEQVESVGGQRGEVREQPPDALAETGHHGRDRHEDQGQRQPFGRPGRLDGSEVQDLVAVLGDLHREGEHERDQRREDHRPPRGDVAGVPGAQEAESDAEERAEQDEVREVAEVEHVRPGPPDQRQLDEQHQPAGHDESPGRHRRRTYVAEHETTMTRRATLAGSDSEGNQRARPSTERPLAA